VWPIHRSEILCWAQKSILYGVWNTTGSHKSPKTGNSNKSSNLPIDKNFYIWCKVHKSVKNSFISVSMIVRTFKLLVSVDSLYPKYMAFKKISNYVVKKIKIIETASFTLHVSALKFLQWNSNSNCSKFRERKKFVLLCFYSAHILKFHKNVIKTLT
jgi:hypothetical protein